MNLRADKVHTMFFTFTLSNELVHLFIRVWSLFVPYSPYFWVNQKKLIVGLVQQQFSIMTLLLSLLSLHRMKALQTERSVGKIQAQSIHLLTLMQINKKPRF